MAGWHLRLWRRFKVAPGVTVNLSKSGTSVSLGPRGAKVTFGHGRVRQTIGLPGTGLYATQVTPTTPSPTPPAIVPEPDALPESPSVAASPMAPSDLQELHFGWPLVFALVAGGIVGVSGAGLWQAVDVAAVAWVGSLLYEWVAHHHPSAARLLVHAAIALAAVAATVATLAVVLGAGVVFAGGRTRRRRR